MDPIIGSALIGGGFSLAGGALGLGRSDKGAKRLASAIREATEFQEKMYKRGYRDLAPYRAMAEPETLDWLKATATEESPLYKWQLEQQQKAIDAKLASMGRAFSGAALQATTEGTNYLSAQEAENRFNRGMGLAQMGYGAAGLGAQLGQQYGATAGQTMVGGTGNLAGLYAQQGEYYPWMAASLNQSLQGALGNYYFKQFLDKYGGGNATT